MVSKQNIPALRFKQWLDDWNDYDFSETAHRRRPPENILMFSMSAAELRKLCDVYKRERDGADAEGIQRIRDVSRTGRIQRYVRFGYPYGDLKQPQRTAETLSLRKPGWLPTAIVLNILVEGDERRGRTLHPRHLVNVIENDGTRCMLELPADTEFTDSELAPFEVIDGQHRLAASVPNHCIDGWSYASRSLSAVLAGDGHAARHLAYYAQLRAGLCILANLGVGVFNRTNFIVTAAGAIERLDDPPLGRQGRPRADGPGMGTHDVVWDALRAWTSDVPTSRALLDLLKIRGSSLRECLDKDKQRRESAEDEVDGHEATFAG